jgi:uncharacterized protein (TIGR03067 family)
VIFAALAFCLCGLPNSDKQPLGMIAWTIGGAILGATSAGAMTRGWRNGQARRKLRGSWLLIEEDGRDLLDNGEESRRLILKGADYEEQVDDARDVRGGCWTDPMTEPLSISLTPKTGPDAGNPRPGIYRLNGKVLTVCLAYPGHPRPKEFIAQPDVQQLRVYRRCR